jgi:5'-3' exonuclease
MGVPRLAPFIFNNFRRHRYDTRFRSRFVINNLYIDANAVLHKSAQRVFNYGEGKLINPLYGNLSFAEKKIKCFEGFISDLQEIINLSSPTSSVVLALDGSAPIAKQAQQRQRRFISARMSQPQTEESTVEEFSSIMITPGTNFMNELDRWMKDVGIPSLFVNKNVIVIFSPCFIPGEGEHKILDYIRERSQVDTHFRNDMTHCMFGPDGDLIMLTLATPVNHIYLLRDGRDLGTYDFLDISSIRHDMIKVIYPSSLERMKTRQRTIVDVSNDFIFAGFFVGNDFLPKINMFFFLEDGLEMMLRSLNALSLSGKFITENGRITPVVKDFITSMAYGESNMIMEQQYRQVPQTEDNRFVNWTLIGALRENRSLDFVKYRRDFYTKKFGIDVTDPLHNSKLENVCKSYWRMLTWVFEYYTQGILSSGWEEIYPYHYAPLMTDLSKYVVGINDRDLIPQFVTGAPSTPMAQLCSILPPVSHSLLPSKYRHLLQGQLDFPIDYEGKTKEYQGIALIEFADVGSIRKSCMELGDTYPTEKLRVYV